MLERLPHQVDNTGALAKVLGVDLAAPPHGISTSAAREHLVSCYDNIGPGAKACEVGGSRQGRITAAGGHFMQETTTGSRTLIHDPVTWMRLNVACRTSEHTKLSRSWTVGRLKSPPPFVYSPGLHTAHFGRLLPNPIPMSLEFLSCLIRVLMVFPRLTAMRCSRSMRRPRQRSKPPSFRSRSLQATHARMASSCGRASTPCNRQAHPGTCLPGRSPLTTALHRHRS